MSFSKSFFVISALCCVALVGAYPNAEAVLSKSSDNPNLRDQWTWGNCGSYVKSSDLVFYDHCKIQANSASSSLTDTINWVGLKSIYCVELIGNQGTQMAIKSGGVNYKSISVSGTSAVGKDLEGIVYIYAH